MESSLTTNASGAKMMAMNEFDKNCMKRAIQMAKKGMNSNAGGPFGCVISKNGKIIAEAHNSVVLKNDPTAHAEVEAIRKACLALNAFQLEDCTIYTSCEPCPMCLGAIYWARPKKVFYACDRSDAANAGFDDQFIYKELELKLEERKIPFEQIEQDEGLNLFRNWKDKEDRTLY